MYFWLPEVKNSEYQLGFDVQFGQFALLKGVVIIYVCGAYRISQNLFPSRHLDVYTNPFTAMLTLLNLQH